jgi:hypothetical protein
MNANTIAGYVNGTKRNQIPVLTTAATTATIISANTDTGTAPAVLSIPLQTAIVGSSNPLGDNANASILVSNLGAQFGQVGTNRPYFNSDSFNGVPFKVRVAGTFNSAVASNGITISLYLGSSATVGSNSLLGTVATTATGVGVATGHFVVEAVLIWDSVSGKLDGSITGFIAASGGTPFPVATASVYATQASAAAASNLQFVTAATFATTNAANSVQVTEFALDQI